MAEEGDEKMRGFAKRVSEDPDMAEHRQEMEDNPELKYKPQSLKEGKEKVAEMTDEQRLEAMNDLGKLDAIEEGNNFGVLAGVDMLQKAVANGEDIQPIMERLSKAGTKMGQLIRQFAELKTATPEGALAIIESELDKHKRKLTEPQREDIRGLAKEDIIKRQRYKEAQEKAKENFNDENIGDMLKAKKAAEKAYIELGKKIQATIPRKFWDLMGTTLQGNLLTPMSQITNIYANMAMAPLRFFPKALASSMDATISYITGKERTIKVTAGSALGYLKGFGYGVREAGKQIVTGVPVGEMQKVEISRGFRPLHAFVQAFTGKDMPRDRKGKIPVGDRFNKMIEGTVGMPAEVMFRLLNLGDKPFLRAAERSTIMEAANAKGLKGEELKKFLHFPDQATLDKMGDAGLEATFQEKTGLSDIANNLFKIAGDTPVIGGAMRFLAKTQMPYVKTPSNILMQTLDYAIPPISLGKAIIAGRKGDRRKMLINIGKTVTGMMIVEGARVLATEGIISPSADEEKKVRGLQYEILPPNSLNRSALERFMNGGDPSPQPGDEIMNYTKMGITGAIFNIYANIQAAKEKEGGELVSASEDPYQYAADVIASFPELASFVLEQSFMKGTTNFLKAVEAKEWEAWMANTFRAVASIPMPNTLDAISRANYEYIPSIRGKDIEETMSNVIKVKTLEAEDLPVVRNLWGEKVKSTPEGANPWMYQLFDVTKSREIQEDPLSFAIFDLYKKTSDSGVIPTYPGRNITVDKKTYRLDPKQYERLAELVGKERKEQATKLVNKRSFKTSDSEEKIKLLEKLYRSASRTARKEFLKEVELTEEQLKK